MATNEINRYGHWLAVPVRKDAESGSPVLLGDTVPGVVQNIHKPEREPIPGYVALPTQSGFNLSGEDVADSGLYPPDTVSASVAFIGVWAFEIDGADTAVIGDAVYYNMADDTLALGSGDVLYGHVVNRGTDGRLHVLLAGVTGA